jgi:predicted house-cleaning noncanonical NTP pyrophosphatase (MazG superfamily)
MTNMNESSVASQEVWERLLAENENATDSQKKPRSLSYIADDTIIAITTTTGNQSIAASQQVWKRLHAENATENATDDDLMDWEPVDAWLIDEEGDAWLTEEEVVVTQKESERVATVEDKESERERVESERFELWGTTIVEETETDVLAEADANKVVSDPGSITLPKLCGWWTSKALRDHQKQTAKEQRRRLRALRLLKKLEFTPTLLKKVEEETAKDLVLEELVDTTELVESKLKTHVDTPGKDNTGFKPELAQDTEQDDFFLSDAEPAQDDELIVSDPTDDDDFGVVDPAEDNLLGSDAEDMEHDQDNVRDVPVVLDPIPLRRSPRLLALTVAVRVAQPSSAVRRSSRPSIKPERFVSYTTFS